MTIGQKIRNLRTERGITQRDLADQFHVSFQTVSKWENDENEPDIATLRELARYFTVSVDYLVDDNAEQPQPHFEQPHIDQPHVEQNTASQSEQPRMSGRICHRCHQEIPDGEVVVQRIPHHHQSGRHRYTTYEEVFYHRDCLSHEQQLEAENEARQRAYMSARKRKKSFGWSIPLGIITLVLTLIIMLVSNCNVFTSILVSILLGYGLFAALYCMIAGSFIEDVFIDIASWSIHLPGIIFTFDLGGFAWLIAMKILFALIGIFFGIFVIVLALSIAMLLSFFAFPFICLRNERRGYHN